MCLQKNFCMVYNILPVEEESGSVVPGAAPIYIMARLESLFGGRALRSHIGAAIAGPDLSSACTFYNVCVGSRQKRRQCRKKKRIKKPEEETDPAGLPFAQKGSSAVVGANRKFHKGPQVVSGISWAARLLPMTFSPPSLPPPQWAPPSVRPIQTQGLNKAHTCRPLLPATKAGYNFPSEDENCPPVRPLAKLLFFPGGCDSTTYYCHCHFYEWYALHYVRTSSKQALIEQKSCPARNSGFFFSSFSFVFLVHFLAEWWR